MDIILVEDNLVQQDLIEIYIKDCGYNLVGKYVSAEDAEKEIFQKSTDLILMDINLHGEKSGIELAMEIKKKWDIPVIFITSQTDKSIISNAIKNAPLDVLIKPVQFEQLQASLLLAESKLSKPKSSDSQKFTIKDDYFIFKNGHLFERALLSKLLFAEGMGNYFTLQFEESKATLKGTLVELEDALPESDFVRVNRSVIVALKKIKSFNAKRIFMENGQEFSLSKKISDELMLKLIG